MNIREQQYAGFWIRVGATLIDGMILIIPSLALGWMFPVAGGVLLYLLYKPFFESSRLQATPGKALLGLKVETLDGQRLTFKAAIVRYLMAYVSSAIAGIGYLIAAFSAKKQTLHDMVAQTVVVQSTTPNVNYFDAWIDQISAVFGFSGDRVTTVPKASPQSTAYRLQSLNDLYRQGLITEEEYLNKKAELLKEI